MTDTLELAKALIERASITPDDAGCLPLIQSHLEPLGFVAEPMPFGDTENLWSRRGTTAPLLVFAGHTDVVPTGPESEWDTPPFVATERDGMLYGRGAADMKSSLAAMVVACERFVHKHPDHQGSIAFLLTSDEEGPATNGTVKVVETLVNRQQKINWCVVGEPSSMETLGDTVRNGRRGSISGQLRIKGIQGHVAYPDQVVNPIHRLAPALTELVETEWDQGNAYFPPTSFQVSNMHAGTGAENVVPGHIDVSFNLRFSSELTPEAIQSRVQSILEKHALDFELNWRLSGQPFLTEEGELTEATQAALQSILGKPAELSTGGGTSDGRFIAPTGAQVIELGPINATIHKINECVSIRDINLLTDIYEELLNHLLG